MTRTVATWNVNSLRVRLPHLTEWLAANPVDVIALQAPVAGELRALVGALRISTTLERIGDLAEHIAQIILKDFNAPWVKVSVAKLQAIRNCRMVGVSIEREQVK